MVTNANMQRGLLRLWLLLTVLWVGGMGMHQYQSAQEVKDNSISISLDKDTEFRIDASGMKKEEKGAAELRRFGIVLLPPLVLLLIFPLGGWLVRGFKPEGQNK